MKDPTDQTKAKEFCNGLVVQIRTQWDLMKDPTNQTKVEEFDTHYDDDSEPYSNLSSIPLTGSVNNTHQTPITYIQTNSPLEHVLERFQIFVWRLKILFEPNVQGLQGLL